MINARRGRSCYDDWRVFTPPPVPSDQLAMRGDNNTGDRWPFASGVAIVLTPSGNAGGGYPGDCA